MRSPRHAILAVLLLSLAFAGTAQAASPTVSHGGATSIGQTAATLRADVNPHGAATTYAFQYGTTSAYGAQTAGHSAGPARARARHVPAHRADARRALPLPRHRLERRRHEHGRRPLLQAALPPAEAGPCSARPAVRPDANGVTFTALLNPSAATTTYRFQYGTSTAYGLETFGKSLGAGVVPQSVQLPHQLARAAHDLPLPRRRLEPRRHDVRARHARADRARSRPASSTSRRGRRQRETLASVLRHERAARARLGRVGRRRLQRRDDPRALHVAPRDRRARQRAALPRPLLVPPAHARAAALDERDARCACTSRSAATRS